MLPPSVDHDPRPLQRVADVAVRRLVAVLAFEALAVAVLPGTVGFDAGSLCPGGHDLSLERTGNEIRAIV